MTALHDLGELGNRDGPRAARCKAAGREASPRCFGEGARHRSREHGEARSAFAHGVADGFLNRVAFQEAPPRVGYRLTHRGESFRPLLQGFGTGARPSSSSPRPKLSRCRVLGRLWVSRKCDREVWRAGYARRMGTAFPKGRLLNHNTKGIDRRLSY